MKVQTHHQWSQRLCSVLDSLIELAKEVEKVSEVCNTRVRGLFSSEQGETQLYDDSEKFIESGSAYFAQAFAEALGLVSVIVSDYLREVTGCR